MLPNFELILLHHNTETLHTDFYFLNDNDEVEKWGQFENSEPYYMHTTTKEEFENEIYN